MELLSKAGILVIPILLCSVIALAIFCERSVVFWLLERKGRNVAQDISDLLKADKYELALKRAYGSNSPMGRVLFKALEVIHQDRETLETVLEHAIDKEVRSLSKYLQVMATVANIAPLLGLLGTVTGMIKAFMAI